ncbi:Uncharacterized protein APZ42_032018 [Daphnia magna]|uniref:Uncharacterized protein n=1 Tax=Daphnia magna TaxID=35525 RepID=A0A164MCK7_9CRUS|nr:Uncharacterized protein APZ42_032018 [Daphnia magna]
MDHFLSPTRAATVKDLDDFQKNQHTFYRLQLLPSISGSPITRFDSWLECFESIVDGTGCQAISSQLDFDLYDVGEKKLRTLGRVTFARSIRRVSLKIRIYCYERDFRELYPWMGCNPKTQISA